MSMNKNIYIYKMKMKFDLRYAFLAILVAVIVYKMTVKEKYMCGGKREGYSSGEGKSFEKSGQCPKCGSTELYPSRLPPHMYFSFTVIL